MIEKNYMDRKKLYEIEKRLYINYYNINYELHFVFRPWRKTVGRVTVSRVTHHFEYGLYQNILLGEHGKNTGVGGGVIIGW